MCGADSEMKKFPLNPHGDKEKADSKENKHVNKQSDTLIKLKVHKTMNLSVRIFP